MLWRRRRSRLEETIRSTIVLHLSDPSESLAGILLADYDDCVALTQARLLSESAGRPLPIDGEVLVPHERIRFAQIGVRLDDLTTRELALVRTEGSRS